MTYYGIVSRLENGLYNISVEYGYLEGERMSVTFDDTLKSLTKEQVNEYINNDSLGTTFIYEGVRIGKLY